MSTVDAFDRNTNVRGNTKTVDIRPRMSMRRRPGNISSHGSSDCVSDKWPPFDLRLDEAQRTRYLLPACLLREDTKNGAAQMQAYHRGSRGVDPPLLALTGVEDKHGSNSLRRHLLAHLCQ